ncbi:hypothetical protein NL676_021635 [Syzygium grande]|nr:hypothetical protein NL676_021635 [Syzygium grande]
MIDPVFLEGVTFATFSDGYDDGRKLGDDTKHFQGEMKQQGIYYYYFNGYEDVVKNVTSQSRDTTSLIQLPGLPPLTDRDVPSFFNLKTRGSIGNLCSLWKPSDVIEGAKARNGVQIARDWPAILVGDERESDGDDELIDKEELDKRGMIIPWCSQIEVLSHPSIGCFFTHCAWNSTLKSLVCGVPMVAFPQFGEQMMNAKLVEDAWKVGL